MSNIWRLNDNVLPLYKLSITMEKRDKIVPVRLSPSEEKQITEKANKIGLKLSTYLRLSALEK